MNEYIICQNSFGSSIKLSDSFPYFLEEYEGIHEKSAELSSMQSAFSIGEVYVGRSVNKRNITLYGYFKNNFYERTQYLYNMFPDNDEGTLFYYEDNHSVKINYRVENISIEKSGPIRRFTISLICFNPYFQDVEETKVVLSEYEGGIEFPLEIINDEIEFERKVDNAIVEIDNPTKIDAGMKIILTANGSVQNPTLRNILTQELLTLDMEMQIGDIITITTYLNNKNIVLNRNGVETNINNFLLYGTKYLQIKPGINNFTLSAINGLENLSAEIYYSIYYEAV